MSERIIKLMDIREILIHLRAESSDRQIQKDLGLNRRTIKRYREWAEKEKLLEGELPTLEQLCARLAKSLPEKKPPQNTSSAKGYQKIIKELLEQKVEIAAIYQRMVERGYQGSYSAIYRLARNLEPRQPDICVRKESKPGEEAQVDFGYAGKMKDLKVEKCAKHGYLSWCYRGAAICMWNLFGIKRWKPGCAVTGMPLHILEEYPNGW